MKNTLHSPFFHKYLSTQTDDTTGLVPAQTGKSHFGPAAVTFSGFGFVNLLLGNERPVYEILFRGQVYRMLCRPSLLGNENGLELIRSRAPGYRVDGVLLPCPEFIPNTPAALIRELLEVTNATHQELANEAYDLLRYREKNNGRYPESNTPHGYLLKESLLLVEGEDKEQRSLYETPLRVNPELWTLFLHGLDLDLGQKLIDYVFSSVGQRELGQFGGSAAVTAIKIRYGVNVKPLAKGTSGLLVLIRDAERRLKQGRSVGIRPLTEC